MSKIWICQMVRIFRKGEKRWWDSCLVSCSKSESNFSCKYWNSLKNSPRRDFLVKEKKKVQIHLKKKKSQLQIDFFVKTPKIIRKRAPKSIVILVKKASSHQYFREIAGWETKITRAESMIFREIVDSIDSILLKVRLKNFVKPLMQ